MMSIQIRNEISSDAPAIEAVTISEFLNNPHTDHMEHVYRQCAAQLTGWVPEHVMVVAA